MNILVANTLLKSLSENSEPLSDRWVFLLTRKHFVARKYFLESTDIGVAQYTEMR
jgi:hypothetical protein